MKRRALIWVAAINFAVIGAGCSAARGNERSSDEAKSSSAERSADTTTVSGCLTGSADGRFVLTATPDAAVSTIAQATALDPDRDTNAYVLIGGDNLQAHVGKRVEVVGTLQGHKMDVEQHDKKKTESESSVGGKEKPVVKTNESVDLEVRQLNVRDVRDVAGTCAVKP